MNSSNNQIENDLSDRSQQLRQELGLSSSVLPATDPVQLVYNAHLAMAQSLKEFKKDFSRGLLQLVPEILGNGVKFADPAKVYAKIKSREFGDDVKIVRGTEIVKRKFEGRELTYSIVDSQKVYSNTLLHSTCWAENSIEVIVDAKELLSRDSASFFFKCEPTSQLTGKRKLLARIEQDHEGINFELNVSVDDTFGFENSGLVTLSIQDVVKKELDLLVKNRNQKMICIKFSLIGADTSMPILNVEDNVYELVENDCRAEYITSLDRDEKGYYIQLPKGELTTTPALEIRSLNNDVEAWELVSSFETARGDSKVAKYESNDCKIRFGNGEKGAMPTVGFENICLKNLSTSNHKFVEQDILRSCELSDICHSDIDNIKFLSVKSSGASGYFDSKRQMTELVSAIGGNRAVTKRDYEVQAKNGHGGAVKFAEADALSPSEVCVTIGGAEVHRKHFWSPCVGLPANVVASVQRDLASKAAIGCKVQVKSVELRRFDIHCEVNGFDVIGIDVEEIERKIVMFLSTLIRESGSQASHSKSDLDALNAFLEKEYEYKKISCMVKCIDRNAEISVKNINLSAGEVPEIKMNFKILVSQS